MSAVSLVLKRNIFSEVRKSKQYMNGQYLKLEKKSFPVFLMTISHATQSTNCASGNHLRTIEPKQYPKPKGSVEINY